MSAGWSIGHATTFWASRQATSILQYPVSLRREQQLADRRRKRVETMQDQEDTFVRIHRLQHTQQRSIIETSEAEDLEFWAKYQSWTFCANDGQLDPRKLLPPFRKRTATPLFTNCKCSRGTYEVPSTDDVPLILRRLTVEDQRLLSPFDVHCGDYRRIFNGYRQRTGPFRVSWSLTPVRDRIDQIVDEDRRDRVLNAYYYLLNSAESHIANSCGCSYVEKGDHFFMRFIPLPDTVEWNALCGPPSTCVLLCVRVFWRDRTIAPAVKSRICTRYSRQSSISPSIMTFSSISTTAGCSKRSLVLSTPPRLLDVHQIEVWRTNRSPKRSGSTNTSS